MQRDELLQSLRQLHDELAGIEKSDAKSGQAIDPQTRAALARVSDELNRLLDPEDETSTEDMETSSEGLRGYLIEFEAEHPRLAETLGRLADGLANLGI